MTHPESIPSVPCEDCTDAPNCDGCPTKEAMEAAMPDTTDPIAQLNALRETAELHPRGDFAAHHLRMGPHGMRDAKVTYLDDLDDFGKQLCVVNDPCLLGHPLAVAEYIAALLTEYPTLAAKHREDAATIAALRERLAWAKCHLSMSDYTECPRATDDDDGPGCGACWDQIFDEEWLMKGADNG